MSNATLQVHLSDTVSMLNLLLSCIGRNLYFLYSGVLRAFQAHCFLHFFTIFTNHIEHGTSRGQLTRPLQVPFLRGPSGRKSIQLVGAIQLWKSYKTFRCLTGRNALLLVTALLFLLHLSCRAMTNAFKFLNGNSYTVYDQSSFRQVK